MERVYRTHLTRLMQTTLIHYPIVPEFTSFLTLFFLYSILPYSYPLVFMDGIPNWLSINRIPVVSPVRRMPPLVGWLVGLNFNPQTQTYACSCSRVCIYPYPCTYVCALPTARSLACSLPHTKKKHDYTGSADKPKTNYLTSPRTALTIYAINS